MNRQSEHKYTKGEVVWAKVEDFPWWPAVVTASSSHRKFRRSSVRVALLHEFPRPALPLDHVAPFSEKLAEYSKGKGERLSEAVEAAQRIVAGETAYEGKHHYFDIGSR